MVKVRADLRPYNKKATVLQFKWEILLNFVKICPKSILSSQWCFFIISSVFRQRRNSLESNYDLANTLCLKKTAPLRQVGIYSVIFQIQKIRNIRFVWNFILNKSSEFYYDDVTKSSFIGNK